LYSLSWNKWRVGGGVGILSYWQYYLTLCFFVTDDKMVAHSNWKGLCHEIFLPRSLIIAKKQHCKNKI
jgi:hypothetical protein